MLEAAILRSTLYASPHQRCREKQRTMVVAVQEVAAGGACSIYGEEYETVAFHARSLLLCLQLKPIGVDVRVSPPSKIEILAVTPHMHELLIITRACCGTRTYTEAEDELLPTICRTFRNFFSHVSYIVPTVWIDCLLVSDSISLGQKITKTDLFLVTNTGVGSIRH